MFQSYYRHRTNSTLLYLPEGLFVNCTYAIAKCDSIYSMLCVGAKSRKAQTVMGQEYCTLSCTQPLSQ